MTKFTITPGQVTNRRLEWNPVAWHMSSVPTSEEEEEDKNSVAAGSH